MEDIKVSVIVPIYNVERFIVRCVESLLSQTLKEVEFIFVDDATPDRSIELLQETIDGTKRLDTNTSTSGKQRPARSKKYRLGGSVGSICLSLR